MDKFRNGFINFEKLVFRRELWVSMGESYDYKAGKKRVEEILSNSIAIKDSNKIPTDEDVFTFNNGYYVWVTAIFVDIRNSSELFSQKGLNDKKKTAKMIRSFTSEIIEILRVGETLREIGIRGDCVYAVYTTSTKQEIMQCANKTFYVNTYLNMLNKLLEDNELSKFEAGVGMASAQELVIKAGRQQTGINSKVWIGDAVTRASNLSSYGQSSITQKRLFFSDLAYSNFIDQLKKENPDASVESWFSKHVDLSGKVSYYADLVNSKFNTWIEQGMSE